MIRREPVNASVSVAPARQGVDGVPSETITVTSPLVGVWRGMSGDAALTEGDHISAGQTVGSVEAMRMFNRVQVERGGVIERLLVEDGQGVEYGQTLLVLRAT